MLRAFRLFRTFFEEAALAVESGGRWFESTQLY
jgi:hypothetical protein